MSSTMTRKYGIELFVVPTIIRYIRRSKKSIVAGKRRIFNRESGYSTNCVRYGWYVVKQ